MNEDFVIRLLEAFGKSGAAELELREGSLGIVLRKGGAAGTASAGNRGSAARPEIPPEYQDDSKNAGVENSVPASGTGQETVIVSPIVATFYASSGPDSPPFVTRGSRVKKGDTLCILEAMKMMNHLEAEFDCEIAEIKAAPGDMVEFGQALFNVRRI